MTRGNRLLAAATAAALLGACGIATSQVTIQFGRGGVRFGSGYGAGYGGYGYGNPYAGSGYNPYLGGGYARGGRGDWYYDRYQPRPYGGVGHTDAAHHVPNWNTYQNPNLYGPGGPYSGYGYDRHGHPR